MTTKAGSKEEVVTGIVARGRTLVTSHPTEMVEFYRPDMLNPNANVLVRAPRQVSHDPGTAVLLSRAEYNSLRELGFVVDPNDTTAVQAARASRPAAEGNTDAAGHVHPGLVSSQRY